MSDARRSDDEGRFLPGWGWPMNARKAHYFVSGAVTSICGRWLYTGRRDTDTKPSPDDCAVCRRLFDKAVS